MQKFLLLAAAPLAALLCGFAPVSHDGVYGVICVSSETGDIGGLKIEVSTRTKPQVTFLLCEGWCEARDVVTVPAALSGETIQFELPHPYERDRKEKVSFSGRFTRGGLVLRSGEKTFFADPKTLKQNARCRRGQGESAWPWVEARPKLSAR